MPMPIASGRSEAQRAYVLAPLVVNRAQAQALADLVWEGKLSGTTLADVEPPSAVALCGMGPRESMGRMPAQNRDGSHRTDDGRVLMEVDPEAHTLAVLAEDGRVWSIVRAGIVWPVQDNEAARTEDEAQAAITEDGA